MAAPYGRVKKAAALRAAPTIFPEQFDNHVSAYVNSMDLGDRPMVGLQTLNLAI